jgi:hypothetical protein
MNASSRGYGYDAARMSPSETVSSGRPMFEGYRKDALSNFESEKPRYNLLNAERPQSSALVDLKDPIQVHLLTETALSDSKEYEILSQEEVDDLKKQVSTLSQRIEQTRANLAIQAKYRDAAISMAKLYSPGRTAGKRKSLLGNRNSGEQSAREAEEERMASEKRCEELANELFNLEKRLMEPQRRILQHTAGILQMTHRAPKRPNPYAQGQPQGQGIPGSPESLYTYTNGRDSLEPTSDDPYFDDRSLYLPMDGADRPYSAKRKNSIDIPIKSPIREQTNQLREESKQLREENDRLKEEVASMRAMSDAGTLETDALRRQNADNLKVVSYTEKRLEDLNKKLRHMVIQFNPAKNANYKSPPTGSLEPGDLIASQLDYLSSGLMAAQQEQQTLTSTKSREAEVAATAASASLSQIEIKLEDFNSQMREVLISTNTVLPPLPNIPASNLDAQLEYLESSLRALSTSTSKPKDDQSEAVLQGLWDIIQTGYAGIQQRKAERRKTRSDMGLEPDEEDMSGDEAPNTNEPYSLSAFSTKVQWLYAQATSLKDQKSVLKRQIKQQRELNNKSDSEKELEMKTKSDELQRTKDMLEKIELEAKGAQEKLTKALLELETLRQTSSANETAAAKAMEGQLKERNTKIASLEAENKTLQAKLAKVETDLAALQTKAKEANSAKEATDKEVAQLQKQVTAKDAELEQANMTLAELKTEVTIAKAELEGAYGSRAQRAAEAAALSKNSSESAEVKKLKEELASTLKEFEDITKETITAEKEKLDLEGKLDDALAAKAGLEAEAKQLRQKLDTEVARLQEQLDSERLKVGAGGAGAGGAARSGATMLSEQFRATMKEERRKFQEELRVGSF